MTLRDLLQAHYDHLKIRCRYPAKDENLREMHRQRAALAKAIDDLFD